MYLKCVNRNTFSSTIERKKKKKKKKKKHIQVTGSNMLRRNVERWRVRYHIINHYQIIELNSFDRGRQNFVMSSCRRYNEYNSSS